MEVLDLEVLEMAFPGVFKRTFPLRKPSCFVRIHARLGIMLFKFHRCFMTSHGSNISQI